MLVDYSPNSGEDLSGKHFTDDDGVLLEAMLNSVGLSKRDFYLTKVIKCKPDYGVTVPSVCVETCTKEYLLSEATAINPKAILVVGSDAGKFFAGNNFRITIGRGWFKWYDFNVYITYHPRYLLRFPSLEAGSPKWNAWNDLKEFSTLNYPPF